MARIFKPRYPVMRMVVDAAGKPVMEEKIAARGPRKGRRVAVPKRLWIGENGKPLPLGRNGKPRKGAKRMYRESRTWAIEYRDATGKRRVVMGTEYLESTREKAAAIELAVSRQRIGISAVDPRHGDISIDRHVSAWLADLDRGKRSAEYIRKVRARVERAIKELGWGRLGQITADAVSGWLAGLATAGASDRTINHYHAALMRFCAWCVTRSRMDTNPLRHVSKIETPDPAYERRALTVEELDRLVSVHPRRGLVYLTAALTGLRKGELKALAWGDMKLDSPRPHIVLRAQTTKSRRADTVAVNDELAGRLRGARPVQWQPGDRVFSSVPRFKVFHRDLRRAGIERVVDGRHCDFHSLRVTFGTMLATSGVAVRTAMVAMRHTDIRLTTRVYTDPRLIDMDAAVNSLPKIAGEDQKQERAKATGTDGVAPNICSDIFKKSAPTRFSPNQRGLSGSDGGTDEGAENTRKIGISCTSKQRRGGDSNPRYPFEHTGFRNQPHQPLGHLSRKRRIVSIAKNRLPAFSGPRFDEVPHIRKSRRPTAFPRECLVPLRPLPRKLLMPSKADQWSFPRATNAQSRVRYTHTLLRLEIDQHRG